jgi:fructose-1,6-bisphosphatase/inositol monophosphatase family enzyme
MRDTIGLLDLEKITALVEKAGEFALEHHGKTINLGKEVGGKFDSVYNCQKTAFSIVDATVQGKIMQAMTALHPNVLGIVAEEMDEEIANLLRDFTHINTLADGKYTLLIDPIDGTRNFCGATPGSADHEKLMGKYNFWGISVAIVGGREPVAGVIHYPALNNKRGITLTTKKGIGTFINGERVLLDAEWKYSETSALRVSSAVRRAGELRQFFPSDEDKTPGSYVVTFLAMLKGASKKPIALLEEERGIINYQGYFGRNVDALDLGCCSLAWQEAGGFIGGRDLMPMNPFNTARYDTLRRAMVIDDLFVMVPSRDYLTDLCLFLEGKGVKLEGL